AVQQAQSCHMTRLARPVPDGRRLDPETVSRAIAEGALLGSYRFTKHKSEDKTAALSLTLVGGGAPVRRKVTAGLRQGQAAAEAQILARDLANEPPSHLTPKQFAKEARTVSRKNGLGISVLGPAEIRRAGLGALLAVARGSDEPPQFIKLTYRPRKTGRGTQKHIVLVGKSITYDSGGLNLKPSRGGMLEEMKLDMSGGAAVLGAMSALKRLGVKHKVTGYLPATENLLGGSAYKPGDVVRIYNGKTIEVGNTDAEGRLTLADALAYSTDRDKPDEIIDLATLTATDISLGPAYAAIFASQPRMEARFKEAGEHVGEKVWPLPFPEEYDEMTKSAVADFSNIVSGRAYTLSGPLLLKHFVGKVPWVHLDIGGPAIAGKDSGYTRKGGSGFGARLLLEYLSD
ncbi:MAG: leucyl aminopeptidase, partial [Patescibacteria group bacterium]